MKEEKKLTIVSTINKNSVIDTETDMVGCSEKEIMLMMGAIVSHVAEYVHECGGNLKPKEFMVGILEAAQLASNVDTINPN
jgi:hypothetical protein